MMKGSSLILFTLALTTVLALPSSAETIGELKARMDKVAEGFHGVLGYSLHFRGKPGESISFNGDEPFPTASTIKTAIMCEALQQVEQGKIKWTDQIEVQAGLDGREEGGFAYYFKDGTKIPLDQWLHLMITMSDNTATIRLREYLGQKNVNDWLESKKFKQTRLLNGPQCDELGLRPLQQKYGLGMTTPNEMLRLLEMIRDGKAGSAASCDRMMRLLNHQYWDDDICCKVSPYTHMASKSGAVDRSRSDAAVVTSPSGEYVLTVYTKQQEDQRWVRDNEGDVAIRTLAEMVWRHYDPKHTWEPPKGAENLLP